MQKADEEELKDMESAGGHMQDCRADRMGIANGSCAEKGRKVRICTDFTNLNAAMRGEIRPMATVDHCLCQFSENTVFERLSTAR